MNKEVFDNEEVFGGKYLGREFKEIDIGSALADGDIPVDFFSQEFFFHPNGVVQTVTRDDDRFLGYRANHFVLVDGYVEDGFMESEEPQNDTFLLICNHKGITEIVAFIFK